MQNVFYSVHTQFGGAFAIWIRVDGAKSEFTYLGREKIVKKFGVKCLKGSGLVCGVDR